MTLAVVLPFTLIGFSEANSTGIIPHNPSGHTEFSSRHITGSCYLDSPIIQIFSLLQCGLYKSFHDLGHSGLRWYVWGRLYRTFPLLSDTVLVVHKKWNKAWLQLCWFWPNTKTANRQATKLKKIEGTLWGNFRLVTIKALKPIFMQAKICQKLAKFVIWRILSCHQLQIVAAFCQCTSPDTKSIVGSGEKAVPLSLGLSDGCLTKLRSNCKNWVMILCFVYSSPKMRQLFLSLTDKRKALKHEIPVGWHRSSAWRRNLALNSHIPWLKKPEDWHSHIKNVSCQVLTVCSSLLRFSISNRALLACCL